MQEPEAKSFFEHLDDLRVTLFKSVVVLAIGVILCGVFTKQVLIFLEWPLVRVGQDPHKFLQVLGVMDPLSIQLEISLAGGIIVSLPAILYFIGEFLFPALTEQEKKVILPVFSAGALLFLGGVIFCYLLILPSTITFFLDYNKWLGFNTNWTIQNYIDFVVQMLVGVGLAFETPLVIITLNFFGIVKSKDLATYRRHAILVIVIVACCIVPATDPFSISTVAIPMYILYEICIWITAAMEKKAAARRDLNY